MPRLFVRRTRLSPGPLAALPEGGRSPVSVAPLALAAAAIAAGLIATPQLLHRSTPKPVAAAARVVPAATVSSTSEMVASTVMPVASAALAPAHAAQGAPPAARSGADPSLFQADRLPVLRADLAGLDIGGAMPAPKTPSRRSAAPGRGASLAAAQP